MRKRGDIGESIVIRVPFYDVDSIHVVWHGHYAKYFEEARCALLEKIGFDYDDMKALGYVWPVIDMRLRYIRPARFGQRINVRAELIEWESCLRVHYLITDAQTEERLTRGYTVQVAVDAATGEMQLSSPPALNDAIRKVLS